MAPSLGKPLVLDERAFAERRLRATAQTRVTAVTSHEPITIHGTSGFESLAEGTDAKSGTPLLIYQVMLFDERGYVVMQGLVGRALTTEYLPEFKAMARSFQRR